MKNKGQIGIVLLVIVGFIGLGVVATATNIITIPWLNLNSRVKMERDIVQKTYNADNALYNYHWFKERFEYLKAEKTKVEIAHKAVVDFELAAGDRKDWTFEDKTEDARLRSVESGLRSDLEDKTAEYNAKSKEADRSKFEEDLPLIFDL